MNSKTSHIAKILLPLLLASLLTLSILHSTQVHASGGSVSWFYEDTTTGGDWVTAAGSPIHKYGSYAHILPNPNTTWEEPIGAFSEPIGFDFSNSSTWAMLGDPPYNWTSTQIAGLPFYSANSPYMDEYVTQTPPVTYYVNGTKFPVNSSLTIQYPAFEWNWTGWHTIQTGLREVYYTGQTGCNNGQPGWYYAAWDDAGERSQPDHGYINFTLHFPEGAWLLSLYAYDYEKNQRESQEYRIYDETGALLTPPKQISGLTFDNGVYELFKVFAPSGGFTIIVQVYNADGHLANTLNVLLSGIFVDPLPPTGGFLFPIDKYELLEPAYPWIAIGLALTLIVPAAFIVYSKQKKKKQA